MSVVYWFCLFSQQIMLIIQFYRGRIRKFVTTVTFFECLLKIYDISMYTINTVSILIFLFHVAIYRSLLNKYWSTPCHTMIRHYTILYCNVPYPTILYYTVLCCATLHYTTLSCTVLYHTLLYCPVIGCTVLYTPILSCDRLYCTILC